MNVIDFTKMRNRMKARIFRNQICKYLFITGTLISLVFLTVLFMRIFLQGFPYLDWHFLNSLPSRKPEDAGIYTAMNGTLWLIAIVAPVSMILGVGTALYLEEYAKKNKFTTFIQVNIANLAGVPSVVYGLLGLTIFVRALHLGTSVLAAGLTMSLLILPVVIVAAQEAIRSIPNSLREASYAMGATKWQTILRVVLPAAIPGILTGTILALSRAIGETAPLVVLGVPLFLAFLPTSIFDDFTALPMQIYNWTSRPQHEFHSLAAADILVLLGLLLLMNSVAILLRNKFQKRY